MGKLNIEVINKAIQVSELVLQKCIDNNFNTVLQELNLIFESTIESCICVNISNDGLIHSEIIIKFKISELNNDKVHQYYNFEFDYKRKSFNIQKEVDFIIKELFCDFNKEELKKNFTYEDRKL